MAQPEEDQLLPIDEQGHATLSRSSMATPTSARPFTQEESALSGLRIVLGTSELAELATLRARVLALEGVEARLVAAREMCGMVGVQPGDLLEHHTLDSNQGGYWGPDTFKYVGAADGATRTPVGWHVFRWLEDVGWRPVRGICADGPGSHAGLNGGMRDAINAWPKTDHYNYRADGTFDDHELALPPGACWAFRRPEEEEQMDDSDELE